MDLITRLTPQTTREPKLRHTEAVMRIVIARASSLGMRACNERCSGQTIAMMKSASVGGANTAAALAAAAVISTAATSATAIFTARSVVIRTATKLSAHAAASVRNAYL